MQSSVVTQTLRQGWTWHQRFLELFDRWSEDGFEFVRRDLPKIAGILLLAIVLITILRVVTRRLGEYSRRNTLPGGVRAQQLRTLSGVLYSVGVFVIVFLAALQILPVVGINIGPLLASAGIAGLAIGFGAQTLVKDVITGFFILIENQYDIGDTIKVADRTGVVEAMSLRSTVLRDSDGSLHTIPNSAITVVTNFTRDWTQIAMKVSVSYSEPSDKVIALLKDIGNELRENPQFKEAIVAQPEVPGIERVSGEEVEYLLLVKTEPGEQHAVSRELRRRIKECFEKNGIRPGGPSRVYVAETAVPKTGS